VEYGILSTCLHVGISHISVSDSTDECVYPEVGEVVHSLNWIPTLTEMSWGALWSKVKTPTRIKIEHQHNLRHHSLFISLSEYLREHPNVTVKPNTHFYPIILHAKTLSNTENTSTSRMNQNSISPSSRQCQGGSNISYSTSTCASTWPQLCPNSTLIHKATTSQ
jgi:hypothetical protein